MTHDLINFDDDSVSLEGTANALIGKMALTDKRAKPPHRDSFSDLANLMRAKKLYTPLPTPAPPSPSLNVAPNGRRFNNVSLTFG
jgi:hypothetical protein